MPDTATIVGSTTLVPNAQIPVEGPKALNALLDFTGGASQAFVDLTNQVQDGPNKQISYVQGLYVDNSLGTVDIICTMGGTQQTLRFPAGTQAYVPVLANFFPTFLFSGKGNASPGIIVPVYFLNVPIPAIVWGDSGIAGLTFDGPNLLVEDQAAEASLAALAGCVTGTALNTAGGGGGGFDGPLQWKSQALGTGGSVTLYVPASGRRFYINNMKILMDPTSAFASASSQLLAITDGVAISFEIPVWMPGAPPVPTFGGMIELFSADDMGWLSAGVNQVLAIEWSGPALASGNIIVSFSTLIGDHA